MIRNEPYLGSHDGFKTIVIGGEPSMSDASKNGFPLGSLNRALGDGRTCKGFNWKYIDQ